MPPAISTRPSLSSVAVCLARACADEAAAPKPATTTGINVTDTVQPVVIGPAESGAAKGQVPPTAAWKPALGCAEKFTVPFGATGTTPVGDTAPFGPLLKV